jgi:hypothetical protein
MLAGLAASGIAVSAVSIVYSVQARGLEGFASRFSYICEASRLSQLSTIVDGKHNHPGIHNGVFDQCPDGSTFCWSYLLQGVNLPSVPLPAVEGPQRTLECSRLPDMDAMEAIHKPK